MLTCYYECETSYSVILHKLACYWLEMIVQWFSETPIEPLTISLFHQVQYMLIFLDYNIMHFSCFKFTENERVNEKNLLEAS